MKKLITLFLLLLSSSLVFADSGKVRFINQSSETFLLKDIDGQKIGLPTVISSGSDHNYYLTLTDAEAGSRYDYASSDNLLRFSINVRSASNFVNHHATFQNIDYLTVDWENVLQNSDIHYVLPLYWQQGDDSEGQAVRVDAHNNALIGIFKQEPSNVITVMSYNTDKDGTGIDHNPIYNKPSDILSLFVDHRLPTPDVLMIQEGLGAQDLTVYQQTLSQLAPGNWYGYYLTEGTRLDSNIILINPKFNAANIKSGNIVFKEQCGWGLVGARNAIYTDIPISDVLKTPLTGNLRIFDTHLESGSGSDIFFHAAQVRFSQWSEILNYPRDNVDGLIIGGDFNTMPFFDDTTGITNYRFGDVKTAFDKYLGNPGVNWGQPITCTWNTCSQYTFNIGMWLDRLFNTPLSVPGYKTYVLYPYVAHQVDGYSDHLPVWVTLYYEKRH